MIKRKKKKYIKCKNCGWRNKTWFDYCYRCKQPLKQKTKINITEFFSTKISEIIAIFSEIFSMIIAILIFAIIVYGVFFTLSNAGLDKIYSQSIFEATNRIRIENGIQPLNYNEKLSMAAKKHAEDMCNNNFFNHINKKGETPSQRALKEGYSSWYVGENIATEDILLSSMHLIISFTGHNLTTKGWENSPGHKENMLNPNYKEIGIGTAYCVLPKYVQVFGG
jgi:hypothetical protein